MFLKFFLNTKILINAIQTTIKKNELIKETDPETTKAYNIVSTPIKSIIFKSIILYYYKIYKL